MDHSLKDSLESIRMSVPLMMPEFLLLGGILLLILAGLIWKTTPAIFHIMAIAILVASATAIITSWEPTAPPQYLFGKMMRNDSFTGFLQILFCIAGILTTVMTMSGSRPQTHLPEFYALILTAILGSCLLVTSENLVVAFVSLEIISISSYILTAFAFDKKATEGGLKYFVFGSVASAVMLYGFSLLFGITGSLQFTSLEFLQGLNDHSSGLIMLAVTFSLAGFLYKATAVPMHPWAPDIYEAAPMPVVAFFSVVPKLAGIAILAKFMGVLNMHGKPDWQAILAVIILFTLTVGNFSALWQKNVKRLMAYSSIGQSGFLLVGIVSFSGQGFQHFLFYASVYLILTFLVFVFLQYFEDRGATTIAGYAGAGKSFLWPSLLLLAGLIGLTGLPPTAGFTGKVLLFSSLWEAYAASGKQLLLLVLVFGLLNTVVSLFYYLRIPYYAFVSRQESDLPIKKAYIQNLLGALLVLLVLLLFFNPALLMGWINKITFAF